MHQSSVDGSALLQLTKGVDETVKGNQAKGHKHTHHQRAIDIQVPGQKFLGNTPSQGTATLLKDNFSDDDNHVRRNHDSAQF